MRKNNIYITIIIIVIFYFNSTHILFSHENRSNIIENVIIYIDKCLPDTLKKDMMKVDENAFIERPFAGSQMSFNDIRPYFKCFDIIDESFISDTIMQNFLGNLLNEFQRPVREIIYKAYYRHLNELPLTFDEDIDSLRELMRLYDSTSQAWKTADTINGFYIPKDLNDALDKLDNLVHPDRINIFKSIIDEEKAVYSEYFGIGTYLITNIWKAGGSRLHEYFSNYGIYTHDAIKVIILRSWYRKLNKRPIEFESQVQELFEYEKENKKSIPQYQKSK